MKNVEKKHAQRLRMKGHSIRSIAQRLHVSKSSVSLWVREIRLSKRQLEKLSKNGISNEIIEKRRETRLRNEEKTRKLIVEEAMLDIQVVSKEALLLIGTGLYWAEGSKTKRSVVHFSNSDPRLIQIMMNFFRTVCDVPEGKFRGHVNLHPHLNPKSAEKYWSQVAAIPLNQFFKTSRSQSRASQKKKDSLPYGTFGIYICDTKLFLKIKGWCEGMYAAIQKD